MNKIVTCPVTEKTQTPLCQDFHMSESFKVTDLPLTLETPSVDAKNLPVEYRECFKKDKEFKQGH